MRSVKCAASPLLQALKILRAQGVRTPVVMVTANALPSQRDAYLRAGADPDTRACACACVLYAHTRARGCV